MNQLCTPAFKRRTIKRMLKNCPLLVALAIFVCWMNGLRIVNMFNHHLLEPRDKFSSILEKTDDVEYIGQSVILIGAQKGGTTALKEYLAMHPDIIVSKVREPHWFDNKQSPHEFFDGQIPESDKREYLRKYRNHSFNMTYLNTHRNKTVFEKSPSYLFNQKAAKRIKSTLPKAKIIVLLRDPVERAYSYYRMVPKHLLSKNSIKSFEHCIERDIKILKWAGVISENENPTDFLRGETTGNSMRIKHAWNKYTEKSIEQSEKCGGVVGRGMYALQLSLWWQTYDLEERKSQFFVMRSEDLRPDVVGYIQLKNITDFIGVSAKNITTRKNFHATKNIGPMQDGTKFRLRRLYTPFNDALVDFLGSDWCDPWSWKEESLVAGTLFKPAAFVHKPVTHSRGICSPRTL